MGWTALSLGCVVVPICEILENGGYTAETSAYGFGTRVFLVAAGIAHLVKMWKHGEISWQSHAR